MSSNHVAKILKELSPDDNSSNYKYSERKATEIWNIRTTLLSLNGEWREGRRAYFVANKKFSFRHEGDYDKKPPSIYLREPSNKPRKILLSYTASGSGKTVELAGSAITHNADLAFCINVTDPSPTMYDKFKDNAEEKFGRGPSFFGKEALRENDTNCSGSNNYFNPVHAEDKDVFVNRTINMLAADYAIGKSLYQLFYPIRNEIADLVTRVFAVDTDNHLKVVLAIDEASSCPKVIHGLLRFPNYIEKVVRQKIFELLTGDIIEIDDPRIEVKFSIGGTGIATSTVGSIGDNFEIVTPFHEEQWETCINTKLQDSPISLRVQTDPWRIIHVRDFDTLQKHLPIISVLMQNGRLSSISLNILGSMCTQNCVFEQIILDDIIKTFMGCNGLQSLICDDEKRVMVGASTLAIHLFRELEAFELTVPGDLEEFAREMNFFPLQKYKSDRSCTSVKDIVTKFGLAEPSSMTITTEDRNRIIKPPIVVLPPQQLIAIHMLGINIKSMIEPSWQGFDRISTHFVKCAIASSMAVAYERRPSLFQTLTQIGFKVDEKATSEKVADVFHEMKKWKAVSRSFGRIDTHQMICGLKICHDEFLSADTTIKSCSSIDYSKGEKFPSDIALPFASINYGNSPLLDGFCSFYARKYNDGGKEELWSIAVQGKDILSDSGSLEPTKLNKQAKIFNHRSLGGLFGSNRLLCVSRKENVVISKSKKRDFVPCAFDKSMLLGEALLSKLEEARNEKLRRQNYCQFYNKHGAQVLETSKEFERGKLKFQGTRRQRRSDAFSNSEDSDNPNERCSKRSKTS